jgi:hypothetical protein
MLLRAKKWLKTWTLCGCGEWRNFGALSGFKA